MELSISRSSFAPYHFPPRIDDSFLLLQIFVFIVPSTLSKDSYCIVYASLPLGLYPLDYSLT